LSPELDPGKGTDANPAASFVDRRRIDLVLMIRVIATSFDERGV
jgi:hypothetical protein